MRGFPEAWGLWLCLALGFALSAVAVSVRPPLPADAPPLSFSATRAMADVRLVGAEPHPIGSPANDRVREALLARMTAMGLAPQLREGVGVYPAKGSPGRLSAGTVRNLLGVIPGRDRAAPALLLMAHFDSVANSPGAADDAAGVAATLDIARGLQATGPHARDVMVLLTDGEEAGLLGADAFFHGDPLAARVGAVVNMEARGDAGRASMFETGPGNAETIRLYARTARAPFANSLTAYLYHLLPNDTDFTHAYRAGLPGLNFAFTGDQLAYHTPLATPEHLSQQSLQHMGDQAAPAALALADAAALPARGADLVYFDVFGLGLVAYPPVFGWAVAIGGLMLLALAWAGVRRDPVRREDARIVPVLRGGAAAVAATAAAVLAGRLLGGADYIGGYRLYRDFDRLFVGDALLIGAAGLIVTAAAARGRGRVRVAATLALAALLACVWKGWDTTTAATALVAAVGVLWAARRPLKLWSGWLGATLVLGLAATAAQACAPLAAPILAWPFLLAASGTAVCAWASPRLSSAAFAAAGALAVVALAALGALANALFTAIGPGMPAVLALFVFLALPVLAPFASAWGVRRRAVGMVLGAAAGGGALLVLVACAPPTAARPGVTQALLLIDPAGASRRVSALPRLDPWSRAALAAGGAPITRGALPPVFGGPVWSAPAVGPPLPPPRVTMQRHGSRVTLTAKATGGGRTMRILLRAPGPITDLSVQGRPVRFVGPAGDWSAVDYAAPPSGGVVIAFTASAGAQAQAFEQRDGWPSGSGPPPKPPERMAFGESDTTLVGARAGPL